MYRVNSKGLNNVPFGRYKNPSLVNEEVLRAAAQALRFTEIQNKPFEDCLAQAKTAILCILTALCAPERNILFHQLYDRRV